MARSAAAHADAVLVSYLSTILADNPEHYWELGPYGAQLFQDLGSAPAPLVQQRVANGGYGGVWDGGLATGFSGSSQLVTDANIAEGAPITIEAWIWIYSFSGAVSGILLWDGATVSQVYLIVDATRHVAGQAGGVNIADPAQVSVHTWHHTALVFTGAVVTLWVDGINVATVPGLLAPGAARTWNVGAVTGGSAFWNGLIASPAVYRAALSGAQLAAHIAAADNKTVFPTFQANVAAVVGGGFSGSAGTAMSDIRRAVYRTFTD